MTENQVDNINPGELESELRQELSDIDLLLEQSKGDLEKLTQRNATVSSQLQTVQSQIEAIPAADVRAAYDAALESQQRLVLMRGQMEKLQSEKQRIESFLTVLRQLQIPTQNSNGNKSDGGTEKPILALIQAQESERQRLSRQMHDGPAQSLSNFVLQAEIAKRLFEVDPEKAREELDNLKNAASATFEKVRDFISELHPVILDELGLASTIERYANSYAKKTGMSIEVSASSVERVLESFLEVLVFRTVQEIISSPELHDQASSVTIQLEIGDRELSILIEDDGRGFDSINLPEDPAMILKAINERVGLLKGSFDVQSTPGTGSQFSVSIPLPSISL
jgi:two-component system sensor histidine kinase DegS